MIASKPQDMNIGLTIQQKWLKANKILAFVFEFIPSLRATECRINNYKVPHSGKPELKFLLVISANKFSNLPRAAQQYETSGKGRNHAEEADTFF